MIEVEIHQSVFNACYLEYLEDFTDTQIFFGGAASGKSRFVAQRTVFRLLQGRNSLIARKVASTLRASCFSEILQVIGDWNVERFFDVRPALGTITCIPTGAQAVFVGLDNPEKIKSIRPANGVFDDVWVEEATEISFSDYRQLRLRQRGASEGRKTFTLSFNPILRSHWINQQIMLPAGWTDDRRELRTLDLLIFKTTYRDNRFLTPQDVERLEGETDKYWRDVYVLGNWGVLGNVIFRNWKVSDLSSLRQTVDRAQLLCGLDFGYAQDPAAFVVLYYDIGRKRLNVLAEYYQTGMTNPELAQVIREMVGDCAVYCDSAEPKSIDELRAHGINAYPAPKGGDRIRYGIQWLQQQEIVIDRAAINAQNEFASYKWRENSDGTTISPPTPVDRNNHIIDAIRYALTDHIENRRLEFAPSLWR